MAQVDRQADTYAEKDTLPRPPAVKTRHLSGGIPAYLAEQDYVVSPSTPLLSTEVQDNAWVCGDNSRGQLGVSGYSSLSEPQPIQGSVGRWACLAVGPSHTAGITYEGQLYAWGLNSQGQLGHTASSNGHKDGLSTGCPTPVCLDRGVPSEARAVAVACGLEHTVCITSAGVLAWGANSHGQLGHGSLDACPLPKLVAMPRPFQEVMVTQVACGNFHTLCVTAQSQVYAWGCNSSGQLGLGDKRDRHAPEVVDALWALPVVQLAAGEYHSAALTSSGQLFTWGANPCGQLGLPPDAEHTASNQRAKDKRRRRKVDQKSVLAMMEMGIPKLRAELALEETGCVGVEVATEWLFSAPDHIIEQCLAEEGYSSPEAAQVEDCNVLLPRRVPLKNVRYVAAGASHTVAVASTHVYAWGEGRFGALGTGSLEDRPAPAYVAAMEGRSIDRVACGRHHTLLLSSDGTVYGCGSTRQGQLGGGIRRPDGIVATPVRLSLPFSNDTVGNGLKGKGAVGRLSMLAEGSSHKAPVVQQVLAGGDSSMFLTRGADEMPEVQRLDLLERLQSCIAKAALRSVNPLDKVALAMNMRQLSNGIETVFGSAAAMSATFGYRDSMGIDVVLLNSVQTSILRLFSDALPEEGPASKGEVPPSLAATIVELHKYSLVQAMYKSALQLLEDLNGHARLLSSPERAQVLLAAAQHPLLGETQWAKTLLPRLCSVILAAPSATRHLLVKWWSDYPGALLDERVVAPLQAYLTRELMATKKLTPSVMNAIKVLARVEEANQINRKLPPEAFYNQLISEKMDVQDHYTAWRQTQDQPPRRQGFEGPFSFCSYPFLLDARAKSNLLYIEARFQMEQTVAHARMEQQLYGGASRGGRTHDDQRIIASKPQQPPRSGDPSKRRSTGASSSTASSSSSSSLQNSARRNGGLRSLLFTIMRGRTGQEAERESPKSVDAGAPRDGCMNLPRPCECTMPATHSDMCLLRVRRTHLVEDALDEISRQLRRDLFKPLRVHFIGEDGIDAGGVKKEFFQLLVGELLSPDYGMLVYQPESHTFWFNTHSLEGEEQFQLLGLVLGLAVYNRVLLDFPLPLALYKKLLGQPVGLRELEDMQPTLGRSLRQLLQYDGPGSVEETFFATFSVDVDYFGTRRSIDLKPGGESIWVTEENRLEYVELLADFWLSTSISRQYEAFAQGFRTLCDGPAIHLFNAQELERLVCGNPNLDFDALERNAKYEGGFSPAAPVVQWLWDVVRGFSLDEKKLFLKFFTGSDRSPIGGLGALKCIIQRDGQDSGKLPTSHTCFNTLLLPDYCSRDKMRDMLRLAIMNSEGFGLE